MPSPSGRVRLAVGAIWIAFPALGLHGFSLAQWHRLVDGSPRFDETVPMDRRVGRQITRVLVWLTTLSFGIADTMCGFRCYPLDAAIPLLQKHDLGRRMDFDPEIAVRLYWEGVRVINVETPVTYPAKGLSHYDRLHDNVLMTSLHVRLLALMMLRMPIDLWRRFGPR